MGDIKLFRIDGGTVSEIDGRGVALEKSLQNLFEGNLPALVGVRLLASEFSTTHGGRIDTLGIDENNCPVIIEYKRSSNENVVNQGLFYLDWLMDHRRDFEWLVLEKLGETDAKSVEWSAPRLICIAGDFNKFDVHAVNQMNRNIELIRYVRFDNDLLLLDLLTATAQTSPASQLTSGNGSSASKSKTVLEFIADADSDIQELWSSIQAYLLALGDDVQERHLKFYIAFKRIKNFACIQVHPQDRRIRAHLKVNPDEVELEHGFTRDVRNVGHYGTGDLEVTISTLADFERAKPLFERSYDAS
jgi:predicted transport protein